MADNVKTEEVDFYNPHDTLKREEGVYLDYQERVHAEEQRAIREDRDADLDNLPAGAGTPLATRAELPATPVAVAPEPFTTLDVPVSTDYDELSDEHQKLVAEANKARDEDIYQARLANIKAESAAAKTAAETRESNATADLNTEAANASTQPRQTPRERTAKKATAKKATAKKATPSK